MRKSWPEKYKKKKPDYRNKEWLSMREAIRYLQDKGIPAYKEWLYYVGKNYGFCVRFEDNHFYFNKQMMLDYVQLNIRGNENFITFKEAMKLRNISKNCLEYHILNGDVGAKLVGYKREIYVNKNDMENLILRDNQWQRRKKLQKMMMEEKQM